MTISRWTRRWIRRHWFSCLAALGIVYFGYHAVFGPRGLETWRTVSAELEAQLVELESLKSGNAELAEVAGMFQHGRLSADLAEEALMKLGYLGRFDVIVLDRDLVR